MITFTTTERDIIVLPKQASDKLPTRGMTMVAGTINSVPVLIPLEPNGEGSHWFSIDTKLQKSLTSKTLNVSFETTKDWPEPVVSAAITQALRADSDAYALWKDITPMARWDWLRWIESVKQEQTRAARPAKLISMLKSGKRRPCCFNRALQTPPRNALVR